MKSISFYVEQIAVNKIKEWQAKEFANIEAYQKIAKVTEEYKKELDKLVDSLLNKEKV